MATQATLTGKGKALPDDQIEDFSVEGSSSSGSDTSSDSDSDSDASGSDTSDSDEEEITEEYLESLLDKARQSISSRQPARDLHTEEEVIQLGSGEQEAPLPSLDPGRLPSTYIEVGIADGVTSKVRDLETERAEKVLGSGSLPAPPPPPPEITKSGKPLTKNERKALKSQTAGKSWFDLPAPAAAELPQLYREVEALRLRNQLDPKRFYRKDEGEGRGIKGLPKHFVIGTIVAESNPFGNASSENLTRASRKRTLVDELVDDAEAKSYAKKKFRELQTVRGSKGKATLAQKKAMRKPKW